MILSDFLCPDHGPFEELAPAETDAAPCPECGTSSRWMPSPVAGRVRLGEVARGTVAKPDSPMYCDTRELGEGMKLSEWKAKRQKLYQERRHKEGKSW